MNTPLDISIAWRQMHVCVIGDVMIDEYLFGKVERMSPEAPIPVVDIDRKEDRLGGAANVALNCKTLGAKVTIASFVGDDEQANVLLNLLSSNNINTQLIYKSKDRVTTCKQRIIAKQQQMLRLDTETKLDLNTIDEHKFIDGVMRFLQIEKPDVVIFQDYNKGVLKANVIDKLIKHCKLLGLITAVDPKKNNFFAFEGVDIFKPNLKEINDAFELQFEPELVSLNKAHTDLHKLLKHNNTLITLSEHGVFAHNGIEGKVYPTFKRTIADVSGAGDTVIAVASLVYGVTKDIFLAAQWSNLAGGLVCELPGVVAIESEQLLGAVAKELSPLL